MLQTMFTYSLLSPYTLYRLLSATARVFAKFPREERALLTATKTVSLCHKSLPQAPPLCMTELQMHAFEAFFQINLSAKPDLILPAWKFTVILLSTYSTTLLAACNIKHLACVINAALEQEVRGLSRQKEAFEAGYEFVFYLMRVLSDSQLSALEMEGVYVKLSHLISFYDEMPVDTLKQVIIGIGMFSEIKGTPLSFIDESLSSSLLFAAQKYHTHEQLQQLIWRLFIVFCQRDPSFCKSLLSMDVLGAIAALLEEEGVHFLPVVEFLHDCCRGIGSVFISACLDKTELMQQLCHKIKVDGEPAKVPRTTVEKIAVICDLVAFLCAKCDPNKVTQIMDNDCVSVLEESARNCPELCMLPACIAIEGVVNRFPPDITNLLNAKNRGSDTCMFQSLLTKKKEFALQDHHLFIQDMLSNPSVYNNHTLTELIYVTFQKILKISTQESLARMCTSEFLELYVIFFIRDTSTFPSQASKISFTAHYFVFQMRSKEIIETLKKNNYHTAVSELVSSAESVELLVASMGLLACLISKYYEYLKDVRPFLVAKVPTILIAKAKEMSGRDNTHFGEDFSRILLNMTADKELSLELYKEGFLDQLIEQLDKTYLPVVTRSVIHAIGNIALGGQHIKQVLLDRKVYENLLQILSSKVERGDAYLLSACCRVLHILASGDWAKRKFVEQGSVAILLKMLNLRKDNPEVCWRPLGLLSSLGFMSVMNRRFILTPEVIEAVVNILKESTNGKVISYTTLVFLGSGELDDGSVKLRKMEVGKYLQEAMDKPEYRKQAPDLERWGVHVLEKLNLHTVSVPRGRFNLPSPLKYSINDWPPIVDVASPTEGSTSANTVACSSNSTALMLPLREAFFAPNHPSAEKLSDAALAQLAKLGLNVNEPLFRIGRVYGSTHGLCTNCEKDGISEELVIRPQSLTPQQYQHLIDNGWYRRGGVKMFRLRHNHNIACCDWETRVKVSEFDHRTHRSYKKVLKKMPGAERLTIETKPTHFSREAFDLYNDYHVQRHDKPHKSEYSYCEHIVNSPIANQTVNGVDYGTFHQLYRLDGKLVAIGVIDIVPKGIVSIYMWYNVSKDIAKLSFGVYSALKEIELVKRMSERNPTMQYYYLQGWNGNNKKLSYKANYTPEDFYCPCIVQDWVPTLDGVSQAKAKVLKKDKAYDATSDEGVFVEVEDKKVKADTKNGGGKQSNTKAKKPTDSTDGGEGSKTATAKCSGVNHVDNSKGGEDVKAEGNKSNGPPVPCDAFPNDLERYRKATGRSSVDLNKIVVCLNYSEYMHLSELFHCAVMDEGQRKIMEKRLSELMAALGPELSSQLVIDLKACECEGMDYRETNSESMHLGDVVV